MRSFQRGDAPGASVSLPALLAILTGVGVLFIAWKFEYLFQRFDESVRVLVLALSIIALLWGVIRSFGDLPISRAGRRFRFRRHRVSLPRPGQFYLMIMIVVFSGSLLGRSNMLMLVFSMLAGPFVVNGWITYSMLKRTDVSRRAPQRAMAGEPLTVEVELANRKRLMSCWLMSVRDTVENSEERLHPAVLFARVPSGEKRAGQYHLRLMRRGRYRFGTVQLTARFPLGIVERGLLFELPGDMLVYPRLGRLSNRWRREHFLATDLVERRELRRGAFDDEFHRIREFRWGDNPRAIHWRTSARHNALMVREFRQSRDLNLMVLVDFWLPAQAGVAAQERLELAASLAATVCVSHMKQSRDATLHVAIAGRQLVRWEGESRLSNSDSLMDQFALAEGSPQPDLPGLLGHAAAKRLQGVRTVLVTTRSAGSAELRELHRLVEDRRAADLAADLEIMEADPVGLSHMFELV